ncbi:MAG: class I SAM-dependent methyltransferase family protein [Nitrososphaerales archaeon]
MLKRALMGILNPNEISQLYSSFDIIGDIAIIKIPDPLISKKDIIAKAILDNLKSVKTVLRQTSPISGIYRIRELEYLMGEKKTLTIYKEHSCIFKVDLAKVYFSPRLSYERLRIAEQVKSGEKVVNMFGGVGTFSIIIAKKQPNVTVYNIDINPDAHQLALENVIINKVSNRVICILGDSREVIHKMLNGVADRVLMPLPEKACEYLDVAIEALKPQGGVIHYYTEVYGSKVEDAIQEAKSQIDKNLTLPHRVIFSRVVREVGPRWYQIVLDVEIIKCFN